MLISHYILLFSNYIFYIYSLFLIICFKNKHYIQLLPSKMKTGHLITTSVNDFNLKCIIRLLCECFQINTLMITCKDPNVRNLFEVCK